MKNIDDKQFEGIPKNYKNFTLSEGSNPEDHGWIREDAEYLIQCIQMDTLNPADFDCSARDLYNEIGGSFENGVCVQPDINIAVYWYERAIALGEDLARSNLADILRKGSKGYCCGYYVYRLNK